jgi:cobalt-zinc-cadmium resistance protein CzcA
VIKRLIHFGLHQPLFVLLGLAIFVGSGLLAFKSLPVEAFPDVTDQQVIVITLYEGRAPEEVERQVTVPIEVVLAGVQGTTRMFSHTMFGLSYVVLTFNEATNANQARIRVLERLQTVELPEGVKPQIAPNATPVGEIIRFRLRGDHLSTTELRSLQDWTVERQLRQVTGVADVVTIGGFIKQYEVQPDLEKLRQYKVTLPQLYAALQRGTGNTGGGIVQEGVQQFSVRALGAVKGVEDIERIVLDARNGSPIFIKDVAKVVPGAFPRLGVAGQDGDDDIVQGIILMRKGENPTEVLEEVKERIDLINARYLPKGVQVEAFYDRTWLMKKTLKTVFGNLVEGALLVSLVLYLFLSSFRAALAVAVVIPLSVLATFLGLTFAGIPANLLSLGAMDFGIIVDGAVIVMENILARLARAPENLDEKARLRLIGEATAEVGRPTFFSMLIIIAAHIPIFALQQHEGRIFRPMALSVTAALVGSLILALMLVPLMAHKFLRKGVPHEDNRMVAAAKRVYGKVLDWALLKRKTVAIAALVALGGTAAITPLLGSEFLPEMDEGTFWVNLTLPETISLAEAQRVTRAVRLAVRQVPEVRTVVSKVGPPEDGTDPKTVSAGEFFVDVLPKEQWGKGRTRAVVLRDIENAVYGASGLRASISQPIRDNVLESISQIKGEIVIKLFGDDIEQLEELSADALASIRKVQGVQRAEIDRAGRAPHLLIDIDRERAARFGLNVADIQDVVEMALAGKTAAVVWEGNRRVALAVRMAGGLRKIDGIGRILVPTSTGASVPLAEVANIRESAGPLNIARENGQRVKAISVFIEGRDMGSIVAEAQAHMKTEVKLPEGYSITWSGEFENQQRAMKRLGWVVPVALLLIFVLLFDAFNSLKYALLILVNVPLALIGGIVALFVLGIPLSVSAAIGFIALSGQAVLNGVVMLSVYKQHASAGMTVVDAVKRGSMERLRTVLMTALLAALGLLPMATSHDIGSETQRPLAVVVIGGLISATLLTLVVLPVLYAYVFEGSRRKRRAGLLPDQPPGGEGTRSMATPDGKIS